MFAQLYITNLQIYLTILHNNYEIQKYHCKDFISSNNASENLDYSWTNNVKWITAKKYKVQWMAQKGTSDKWRRGRGGDGTEGLKKRHGGNRINGQNYA